MLFPYYEMTQLPPDDFSGNTINNGYYSRNITHPLIKDISIEFIYL